MKVAGQGRPGCRQLARQGRELLIAGQARQVSATERPRLDRNEMELLATLGIVEPGAPGGEKVVAQAEPGFQDDETIAPVPARRQAIAAEEHLLRLRQGALARVIAVAELGRAGDAFAIELDTPGDDGRRPHGAAGSVAMRRASASSRRSRAAPRPR